MPEQKTADEIPLLYADGILSQAYGPKVAKFFLGRVEPDPRGAFTPGTFARPVLQVVMPIDGFVQMVAFLEMRIRIMIKQGVVDQTMVDNFRKEAAQLEAQIPNA